MEAFETNRFEFWTLTLLGIMNVLIVATQALRLRTPGVKLPLFTILLMTIVIWVASTTLVKGLAKIREQLGEKAGRNLRGSAFMVGVAANAAIVSAVTLIH